MFVKGLILSDLFEIEHSLQVDATTYLFLCISWIKRAVTIGGT